MQNINPDILIWSRETAGLDIDDAARKLGLTDAYGKTASERLLELESGSKEPSRTTLIKMAKVYRRSLLVFYLEKPPQKGSRGTDFRTLDASASTEADGLLDALIRDITVRQHLVRSTMEEEDALPLSFISSKNISDGVTNLAKTILETLKFDLKKFRSQGSVEKAFELLRKQTESAGIFVLLIGDLGSHHSAIDVKTFRGYALADKIAPFVVINAQDAKTAWSFTLLHELVHLWLGETGVSGNYNDLKIEQFCNDVAAEILLPDEEIRNLQFDKNNKEEIENLILLIAKERHISRSMVAYRLCRNGLIDNDVWSYFGAKFREEWIREKNKQKEKNRERESGPDYYVVRKHKVGDGLVNFITRTINEGLITPAKAGKVLGVKARNVEFLINTFARPKNRIQGRV